MSMFWCDGCGDAIDTDEDAGCFVSLGNERRLHIDVVWCESCREKHMDDREILINNEGEV